MSDTPHIPATPSELLRLWKKANEDPSKEIKRVGHNKNFKDLKTQHYLKQKADSGESCDVDYGRSPLPSHPAILDPKCAIIKIDLATWESINLGNGVLLLSEKCGNDNEFMDALSKTKVIFIYLGMPSDAVVGICMNIKNEYTLSHPGKIAIKLVYKCHIPFLKMKERGYGECLQAFPVLGNSDFLSSLMHDFFGQDDEDFSLQEF